MTDVASALHDSPRGTVRIAGRRAGRTAWVVAGAGIATIVALLISLALGAYAVLRLSEPDPSVLNELATLRQVTVAQAAQIQGQSEELATQRSQIDDLRRLVEQGFSAAPPQPTATPAAPADAEGPSL